jgi:hypothetical protein
LNSRRIPVAGLQAASREWTAWFPVSLPYI